MARQLRDLGYSLLELGRGELNSSLLKAWLEENGPAEIYYLAAYHHSSQDNIGDELELFRHSYAVHVDGLLLCLEIMRHNSPCSRLFYAASSHVFGRAITSPQDEDTPLNPICPYGISKVAGIQLLRYYRQIHGLFASVGILYNHESPLRRPEFLSRKIVKAAMAIKEGRETELLLGNLSAQVDFGYAPEYTQAMRLILGLEFPEDFIIASGKSSTVQDFVAAVFNELGLDWQKYVRESPGLLRKNLDRGILVGNAGHLFAKTGWRATMSLQEIARALLKA